MGASARGSLVNNPRLVPERPETTIRTRAVTKEAVKDGGVYRIYYNRPS